MKSYFLVFTVDRKDYILLSGKYLLVEAHCEIRSLTANCQLKLSSLFYTSDYLHDPIYSDSFAV